MIPTGSKLWFGVAGFGLVAAVAYFIASRGEEHGSMVLLSLAVAGLTLGLLSSFLRDGQLPAPPRLAGDQPIDAGTHPGTPAPAGPELAAAWPALGAVGLAVAAVGLATGSLLLYLGLLLVVAAGIEWMVQAWSERVTADPARNRELRNRLMFPFEIPVLAAALIAVVIVAFSRVLLAVPRAGSTIVAIVVAVLILGGAFLITSRPRLSSSLLTGIVALGAVGLLAGGIAGGVAGEREFEAHGEGEEHGGEGEGEPVRALVTASNTGDFDEDVVNVPVGVPVVIELSNEQGGVQHNLHLTEPEDVVSDLVIGPGTATIEFTFEEPGEYRFICDVHPNMEGTIAAVDQPLEGEGTEEAPDEGDEGGGAGVDELDGDGS